MRILFVQGGFGAGGAEKVIALLAKHCAQMGDEVHIAALNCPPDGPFFPYPKEVTLHVGERDGASDGRMPVQWKRFRHIRRVMRSVKPDLVVSFLFKVNMLTLLAATGQGIPVVISERNNPFMEQSSALWRPVRRLLTPKAHTLVMLTEEALQELPKSQRQIARCIPNPCTPIVPTKDAGAQSDGLHIVAVGRLEWQKGFDLLLDAFATLANKHPRLRLSIFGVGSKRPELESQRNHLGLEDRVTFRGLTKTPGAWIGAGDILVVSSRYEGFCNVIAEATVSGVPVVSFDCKYGPRELIVDGKNGLLVPPGNLETFCSAIEQLVCDAELRAAMVRGSKINQDRLAPKRILGLWEELFNEFRQPDDARSDDPLVASR